MRKRAEQQEETRQRIVEAAMKLHEEVGPANTTVSAIAELAGVERLTVYRHFPDQGKLFQACSSLFFETIPFPDTARWNTIDDPGRRTRVALEAIYDYYRETERMWTSVLRDADGVDSLADVMAAFRALLDEIRDDLVRQWKPSGARRKTFRGLLAHAIHFFTWQSMSSQGFTNRRIATLIVDWVEAAGRE